MSWTRVGDALQGVRSSLGGRGSEAGLEAQLLVARAMGRPRSWVLAHAEADLPAERRLWLETQLVRMQEGLRLPYVLGVWEFYGRTFEVQPEVLIPRPETEGLVEAGVEFLRARRPARVLDVGTGSGCVAISIAAEIDSSALVATDLSAAALRIARRNAARHGVGQRVHCVQADLTPPMKMKVDLVVANLPYVPHDRLVGLDVAKSEPRLALDGGPDGTRVIRRLLEGLPGCLVPGGRAILEIDLTQGPSLAARTRQIYPGANVRVLADLAGRDRYLILDVPA